MHDALISRAFARLDDLKPEDVRKVEYIIDQFDQPREAADHSMLAETLGRIVK